MDINFYFGLSWALSLAFSFALGMIVAPALMAQRNKMIIQAVGQQLCVVVDKLKKPKVIVQQAPVEAPKKKTVKKRKVKNATTKKN